MDEKKLVSRQSGLGTDGRRGSQQEENFFPFSFILFPVARLRKCDGRETLVQFVMLLLDMVPLRVPSLGCGLWVSTSQRGREHVLVEFDVFLDSSEAI